MNKNIFICLVFCGVMLQSCSYDKEEELYGKDDCDLSEVSFQNDIMPIIQNSCATVGCHVQGGSSSVLLGNYTQVKAKVDDGTFKQRVLVMKNMPPSVPLSNCQLALIEKWHDIGAPNN